MIIDFSIFFGFLLHTIEKKKGDMEASIEKKYMDKSYGLVLGLIQNDTQELETWKMMPKYRRTTILE